MSESEEESAASTSSDDEVDVDNILAYDKEPEYTEQEIAAGIADIQADEQETAASLKTESHWPPESRVGHTN